MDQSIQHLLDRNVNGVLELPVGEFEGPFLIKRPVTIIGKHTTLWAKKGPVLQIMSKGVSLKMLRVEIIQENKEESENICISSNQLDTAFEKVEVFGFVEVGGQKRGNWQIPRVIELGEFEAQRQCSFFLDVEVDEEVRIASTIKEITFSPNHLKKGRNHITIQTEKLKEGFAVYADILFYSELVKRSYLSGLACKATQNSQDGKTLYCAKKTNIAPEDNSISYPLIQIAPTALKLQKGQRLACTQLQNQEFLVTMQLEKKLKQMEIDPYVFLLDQKELAQKDENLIFFGNTFSKDQSVQVIEQDNQNIVKIALNKVGMEVEKIAVAYAIYGDNPEYNFSKVKGFTVKIIANEQEKFAFCIEDFTVETTLIALEFYRYQGTWKLKAVGSGYQNGIKRLCESFGLEVIG